MANPTIVSGVIVDPGSIPYYPATVTATLTPTTVNPTANGRAINPNPGLNMTVVAPTNTDGSFTMSLFGNAAILPGGTQWLFTVTTSGAARPAGFGMESFAVAITVSGTTQDVGTTLSAAAPALLQVDSGGGGGGSVVLAPSADQTITGAHALILSDAGSNFKVPVIGDLESTLDVTIQGYYSAPVSLIAKNPSVYSGTAVVTQSDGSTFINGLGVVTLVTAASSGGISGIESDVNTDNVVGDFTGGLSAFQAYVNFNGAGTLDSGFGYYLGQVKSTGVMDSFYGLWENDLGSINGAGSITNPYYSWFDSRGVRRVKEDTTFDSVGQAIEALYNPQFTKYTPGAVDFERVVLGQWSGNVAQIGTEAGGTGTPRGLELIGPSVKIDGTIGFYGHAAAAKPTVTGSRGANAALASLLTGLAGLGLLVDSSS